MIIIMKNNAVNSEKNADKKTNYTKKQVHISMVIPIVGWIFIIVGLIFPIILQIHWIFLIIWVIDIFLSVVVHGAQLYVAIPAGKNLQLPIWRIVIKTMVFGATWWKPLRDGIIDK